MNTNLYQEKLHFSRKSVFGSSEEDLLPDELVQSPIILAFLEDDDVQEISLCSTNIGFVYRITKIFKSDK